jgi:AcrR family transcriptional regulator
MSELKPSHEPDTEKRILEAAAKVFIIKGKLGSSMQDIADEAGINRTLLHYYFRSKDKLFDKVFEKLFVKILPVMMGMMTSDLPLQERIRGFVEAYTELLRENPYLPVFIFQEISLNPERLIDSFQKSGIRPADTLGGLKKDMAAAGMVDTDPRQLLASMMGMVLFPYIGRPLFLPIAFQGDEEAYDRFLEERRSYIPEFINMAFAGARKQDQP